MAYFPKSFLFGASTSAYQIEGASLSEGRGPVWWDVANDHQPSHLHIHTGEVACDHYHRFREDIAMMAELGLESYRFSISWSRIFPKGRGEVNPLGVAFYHQLIDQLLSHHITPAVTIWHGDLPLALDHEGGWNNPATMDAYLDYAKFLFTTYGSKVKLWFTHNEPWCASFLGEDDFNRKLERAHHLMVAHAKAVALYHTHPLGDGKIGIVLNLEPQYPKTFSTQDMHAATMIDGFLNRWFLDPILKGSYPVDMMNRYREEGYQLTTTDAQMRLLKEHPGDFIGINVYSRAIQEFDPSNTLFHARSVRNEQASHNEMGGEVCPESLYDLLHRLDREYHHIPIYITENGAAFKDDQRADDGHILDIDRASLLKGNIASVERALKDGIDIRGYYVWSLMDNFEWGFGYTKFFGIIHVNYATQKRTFKESALVYKSIIQEKKGKGSL